jgi:hypothetical protein
MTNQIIASYSMELNKLISPRIYSGQTFRRENLTTI